jgi:mono/diheme cytochrome c family protein
MESMKARAIASLTLVGTLTVALLLVLGTRAEAKEKFLDDFQETYPAAVGTRLDGCSLCHFTDSNGKWDENQFAEEYEEADKDFGSIQNLDTDGDGFTNLQEIQAGTFPGDASDNPNTYVPPQAGSGAAVFEANCAGCHGSNGGDLVPTSLSLSQLVGITTSGRGNMPAFSGTLTSADIQLVSEYLFNWNGTPTPTTNGMKTNSPANMKKRTKTLARSRASTPTATASPTSRRSKQELSPVTPRTTPIRTSRRRPAAVQRFSKPTAPAVTEATEGTSSLPR